MCGGGGVACDGSLRFDGIGCGFGRGLTGGGVDMLDTSGAREDFAFGFGFGLFFFGGDLSESSSSSSDESSMTPSPNLGLLLSRSLDLVGFPGWGKVESACVGLVLRERILARSAMLELEKSFTGVSLKMLWPSILVEILVFVEVILLENEPSMVLV